MFQHGKHEVFHFLVPLDGSHMAESVLPTVEQLAAHFRTKITLLHIIERKAPATIHGERHLTDGPEAKAYLEGIADRLRVVSGDVESHVHENKEDHVAQSLVDHAQELDSDLIIMCTHGRGGVRELLFGSIALQALQRGMRSIWLVQPRKDGSAPPCSLRRILVPFDGTAEHEPALFPSMMLARTFGAELYLVFVVPTLATLSGDRAVSGLLLPATMRAVLDLAQQGAIDYLERTVVWCRGEGIETRAEVLRGDAAPVVLGLAEHLHVDLIVMASHGRTGLEALLTRSVAPRVAGHVHLPLLLIRAAPSSGEDIWRP